MVKKAIATKFEVIIKDKTGAMVNIDYICPYCHYNTGELITIGPDNVGKIDNSFETDQICGICEKDVIVQCLY